MISETAREYWCFQMVLLCVVCLIISGSKYDGEWKDDKKHGKGSFTDKTGKYIGNWKEDRQHGKGQFISIGKTFDENTDVS